MPHGCYVWGSASDDRGAGGQLRVQARQSCLSASRNKVRSGSETNSFEEKCYLKKNKTKTLWKFIQCHILMPTRNAELDLNWFAPLYAEISSITLRFAAQQRPEPAAGVQI